MCTSHCDICMGQSLSKRPRSRDPPPQTETPSSWTESRQDRDPWTETPYLKTETPQNRDPWTETPYPRQRFPENRDPLDRDPIPQTGTPPHQDRDPLPGQRPLRTETPHEDRDPLPPPWTDKHLWKHYLAHTSYAAGKMGQWTAHGILRVNIRDNGHTPIDPPQMENFPPMSVSLWWGHVDFSHSRNLVSLQFYWNCWNIIFIIYSSYKPYWANPM